PAGTPFMLLFFFGDESLAELFKAFLIQQEIDVIGGAAMSLEENRHPAHEGVGDGRLLQTFDDPLKRLLDGVLVLREHVEVLHSLVEVRGSLPHRHRQPPAHESAYQNSSLIGWALKSASGRGRFCGPGSSLCGSRPRPLNSVAATSAGVTGRAFGT